MRLSICDVIQYLFAILIVSLVVTVREVAGTEYLINSLRVYRKWLFLLLKCLLFAIRRRFVAGVWFFASIFLFASFGETNHATIDNLAKAQSLRCSLETSSKFELVIEKHLTKTDVSEHLKRWR